MPARSTPTSCWPTAPAAGDPAIVFGGCYQEPPAWTRDDARLRRIAGAYRLPTGGTLVVHRRGGRFFVGGRGQDAADVLLPPASPAERARRADLTARSRHAVEALRHGDLEPVAALSGPGGLRFAQLVAQELAGAGKGKGALLAVEVLGTFPSGFPLVVHTERGDVVARAVPTRRSSPRGARR